MNLDYMSEVIKIESVEQLGDMLSQHDEILLAISEEWCSVCRVMEGTLINAAFELKGKAVVLKSSVEISKSVSEELGLRSIPAYVVFHNGEMAGVMYGRQTIGAMTSHWSEGSL
ncbi:thioredoxin family protein [Vibrio sp. F74]|uniref:thioredoxin family protein n=1 Tax=Vibrio sp. F74 TaxID=700020 RepID=UPI0035F5E3BF